MRKAGILMPVSALPNKYGIGSFGKEAYDFIDILSDSKQAYWQVLPLNPTSYGDSPYQALSAFAGSPYYINLDMLCNEKLLNKLEINKEKSMQKNINYQNLFITRFNVLKIAYTNFIKNIPMDYEDFCNENSFWLNNYAKYMALKEINKFKSWNKWKIEKSDSYLIDFWKFVQYIFFKQWFMLKKYANSKNIKIIGDMPIYVAYDSADVWAERENYYLDNENTPIKIAGVPPDQFSENGQLWGNPLYNWKHMEENNFEWWKKRIKFAIKFYDIIRIDHFRGFESYYAVPFGNKTAKHGEWIKAPGIKLFDEIKKDIKNANIIAEDLGFLDYNVRNMLKQTGYPGMKVLQFAFGIDNSEYLPKNYIKNCVVYTGTHDNAPTRAWFKTLSKIEKKRFNENVTRNKGEKPSTSLIRFALNSIADIVIIPLQDYMNFGGEARINTPSTLGKNWIWRLGSNYNKKKLIKKINDLTESSER
jgi:4-alpha-glucanotransferase